MKQRPLPYIPHWTVFQKNARHTIHFLDSLKACWTVGSPPHMGRIVLSQEKMPQLRLYPSTNTGVHQSSLKRPMCQVTMPVHIFLAHCCRLSLEGRSSFTGCLVLYLELPLAECARLTANRQSLVHFHNFTVVCSFIGNALKSCSFSLVTLNGKKCTAAKHQN